ncbi:MAG TPA: transglycosylase SLT domain-containing protein [Candidatus Competibacter sp.]|nr:hypothetical protein [Candidatus Competibacteraceae bacterium]HRC72896.1 transglycosylase SLT domain-containing protein [Candidatus Competibacter sp.]
MTKAIQSSITALFIASAVSACAEMPFGSWGSAGTARATPSQQYVDYWRTRDPADYRYTIGRASNRKRVGSSKDVVMAGKNKASGKIGKAADTRISMVVPVPQGAVPQGAAATAVEPVSRGNVGTVRPAKTLASTSKVPSNLAASIRKGKRKPAVAGRKDLWGRVRVRSVLAEVEHPRIDEQIAFLKRNPGYLNLLSQRSRPFLHYIVEQLDRRGLPTDLALVPMVESAFQPTVFSPKDAAGLWQIIPSTGQEHGLLIAEGYDGRLDIHTSTGAALAYLRYLNKLFKGDWLLALAAYNAGPGAVQAAIEANARAEAKAAAEAKKQAAEEAKRQEGEARKQAEEALKLATAPAVEQAMNPLSGQPVSPPPAASAPTSVVFVHPLASRVGLPATSAPAPDAPSSAAAVKTRAKAGAVVAVNTPAPPPKPESVFWRLKLPKETQDYVPRILALARIVSNPEAHGLRLALMENRPYLFRVDLAPEVKIADALVLTGISTEEFFRFNPGFKPGVEPPSRAYNLLLPWEQAQSLVEKVPGARLIAPNKYTVKKGETIATIAKRHGVSSQALAEWNSLRINSVLRAGQKLIVYPAS